MNHIQSIKNFALQNNIPIMQNPGIDFLCNYIKQNNVHKILEIGSAIGYSAICFANCNEEIYVDTIELDKYRYDLAVTNIRKCCFEKKIQIFNEDALTIDLSKLQNDYDLLFIDAAKGQYINFFNRFTPLINVNGAIVTDNLDFHGFVNNPDLYHNYSTTKLVKKIQKFISFLKDNPIYTTQFHSIGDGVAITTMIECAKIDRGLAILAQKKQSKNNQKKYFIQSKKIQLQPINMDNLFGLFQILGIHNTNIKYMLFLPHKNLNETEDFIKSCQEQWDLFNSEFFLENVLSNNATKLPKILAYQIVYDLCLVGEIDICFEFNQENQIEAELGWVVNPKYQNRGIATKSARMLIRYFYKLGINRFIAHIDNRNIASKNVANKLGMKMIYNNGIREYKTGEKSIESFYLLEM